MNTCAHACPLAHTSTRMHWLAHAHAPWKSRTLNVPLPRVLSYSHAFLVPGLGKVHGPGEILGRLVSRTEGFPLGYSCPCPCLLCLCSWGSMQPHRWLFCAAVTSRSLALSCGEQWVPEWAGRSWKKWLLQGRGFETATKAQTWKDSRRTRDPGGPWTFGEGVC